MAMNRLRDRVIRKAGSAADLDEARATIDELRAITDRQRVRIGDLERELARVSPQVAALEARLETLRDAVERGNIAIDAPSDGQVDAASIWAEIQRQQEQVRARITAATRFEERLRRLEDRAT